jgi:transcriptional regulator with XRE-family HTH domain
MESVFMGLRADRLRLLREHRGWSQRELARRCNLGDTQIHKYENEQSDPSSSNLSNIAEQLGVSADFLLGRTDDPYGHLNPSQATADERIMLDVYRREGWAGVIRLGAEKLPK